LARPLVTATNTRFAVSKSVRESVTSHLSYRYGKIKILWLTNFDLSNVHNVRRLGMSNEITPAAISSSSIPQF
jgi:hypothetical protein